MAPFVDVAQVSISLAKNSSGNYKPILCFFYCFLYETIAVCSSITIYLWGQIRLQGHHLALTDNFVCVKPWEMQSTLSVCVSVYRCVHLRESTFSSA